MKHQTLDFSSPRRTGQRATARCGDCLICPVSTVLPGIRGKTSTRISSETQVFHVPVVSPTSDLIVLFMGLGEEDL